MVEDDINERSSTYFEEDLRFNEKKNVKMEEESPSKSLNLDLDDVQINPIEKYSGLMEENIKKD